MSGPVQRPLKVEESDKSVQVQPCTTISFNAADFTVAKTAQVATISIDSTGTGAALTDTYIGFGNASNLLTGSANFTFTDETGGSGPTILLTGDKPILKIQDDTGATDYYTEWQQSGASFYWFSKDSGGTNKEMIRVSSTYVFFNDDGEDIDIKMEGTSEGNLFRLDAAQNNIGIGTSPVSGVERLHVKGTGTGTLVKLESTDAGTSAAPELRLFRNSASPAPNDALGRIVFSGEDDASAEQSYFELTVKAKDETAASIDSVLLFEGPSNSSTVEYMRMSRSDGGVIVNEQSSSLIDFRCETANLTHGLFVDAGNDNIGIGGTPPATTERLHVTGTGTDDTVVIASTAAGSSDDAPNLVLYRNTVGVDDTFLGALNYRGQTLDGTAVEYAEIRAYITDPSNNSEDCLLQFRTAKDGGMVEQMRFRESGVVFNEDSNAALDFRIESDSNNSMFKVDSGMNRVSIGAAPTSGGATFQVPDNTISSYCNVKAVRSDTVATMTFVNEDCQGALWVNDSATAWALDLPESPVKGMHFRFVSTNGDMTVDPNPSGGTSNTINGGTGAISRNVDNQIYEVICIDSNKWILNNP